MANRKNNLQVNIILFFLVISSSLYFLPSGYPQISSFFLFVLLIFLVTRVDYLDCRYLLKDKSVRKLFFFVCYLSIVNIFYFLNDEFNNEYLISSSYYWYNFLLFICVFISFIKFDIDKTLLYAVTLVFFYLFISYAFGLGRFDFNSGLSSGNFPRYNGYFNDPNQMGYWILCATIIVVLISERVSNLENLLLLIAIFLVALTMSRSAIIGFIPLIIFFLIRMLKYERVNFNYLFGFLLIFSIALVFYMDLDSFNVIWDRFLNFGLYDELAIRGYLLPLEYSSNIFWGYGQGGFDRFSRTHEIHSSLIGVLFYYGIAGLIIFGIFIVEAFKRAGLCEIFSFLSVLLFGLFTYGLRSSMVWIVFGIIAAKTRSKS